jgi:hypothetical protein
MRRAPFALLPLLLSSTALAQAPSPAQMGITSSTMPEVLQTLDNTNTWVPIGTVDPTSHTFSASASPNDIRAYGGVADGRIINDATTSGSTLISGVLTPQTVTVSIGSPAIVTMAAGQGLAVGEPLVFATTGALPTGLVAGTTYYVLPLGLTYNSFEIAASPTGAAPINTSGSQSGTQTITSAGTANFTTADVGKKVTIPLAGGPYKLANAIVSATYVPASFNTNGYIKAAPGSGYLVGDAETLAATGGTCATAPIVTNLTVKLVTATLGAAGSGYPVSSTFTVAVASGTWAVPALVSVTTNSSGVVTTVNSIVNPGRATANPTLSGSATSNPTAVAGSGLTLNLATGLDIVSVTTPGSCTAPPTANPLTIASTSGVGTGGSVIAYFTAPTLFTSIASFVDAQHVTLASPATIDAPAYQMAAVFTDNLTAMTTALGAVNQGCIRFPAASGFYGFSGRINVLGRSGCFKGDGAPTKLSFGQPDYGSWILAAHDDVGLYFRSTTPVAAMNDATAEVSDLGVIRIQPTSLVDGVYSPDTAMQCDLYNEKALRATHVVTFNPTCGLRLRASSGPTFIYDWTGQPLVEGLMGERIGDVAHIVSRHFNLFWSNSLPVNAFVGAYMRQLADANLLGNLSHLYVSNSFAFDYRSDYHFTGGINGVAGCPSEIRVSDDMSDQTSRYLYIDYTATCGSASVKANAQFNNVTLNAWAGTTVNSGFLFESSGADIDVQGANYLVNFTSFRSTRSNTNVVNVTGAGNTVDLGTIWTNGWNACNGSPAGCDDGQPQHYALSVLGAGNTLRAKSVPDFHGTTTSLYDAEATGVLSYLPSVEFFGDYSGNIPISSNTNTTVIIDTPVVDTISAWNGTTNGYYPTLPGYYRLCADATGNATNAGSGPVNFTLVVRKNNQQIGAALFGVPVISAMYVPLQQCSVVYLNGTTDFANAALNPNTGLTAARMYGAGSATSIEVKRVGP